MFKTSCNLVAIWGKTEVNMANKQGLNCIGIAASLRATKIASQIACVNGPLCSELS